MVVADAVQIFQSFSDVLSGSSKLSRAYSHACITKLEKETSFLVDTSSICSIREMGNLMVLFSDSLRFGLI